MIQPLGDHVLIERIDDAPQRGGIVLPDIAKEKSMKGKVIAVGPGKRVEGVRQPLSVKVGDLVYFNSKWSDLAGSHYADDTPVHFDRNLHLCMEGDILLVDRRGIGKREDTDSGRAGAGQDSGNGLRNKGRSTAKASAAIGKAKSAASGV